MFFHNICHFCVWMPLVILQKMSYYSPGYNAARITQSLVTVVCVEVCRSLSVLVSVVFIVWSLHCLLFILGSSDYLVGIF